MNMQMPPQPAYELTKDDKQRQSDIAAAWKAIDGLFNKPLKLTPEGIDPNVITNRCEPIVDRGVDLLFGKPVGITCEESAPKEAQPFLEDTWGNNESRLPLLQDLGMNGAAAGRAFLRIVPNKKGDQFRIIAVDPSTIAVQYAPQDCETVLLYCIEYSLTEKIDGQPKQVFYHEEIQRIDPDGNALKDMPDDDDTWVINHWTRVGDRGPWTPAGEPITWPYPFAPIDSCKNRPRPNSFWGKPDITSDLIGVNDAINLALSMMQLDNVLYGEPIIYANGVAESQLDRQAGRIMGLPLPDSKITAVAIPTDLANQLSYVADLRSDMDEQSSIPAVALGRMKDIVKGQVSGVTMELMFMPSTQKTEKKRCLYGDLLIRVSKALLVLGKFSKDIKITLQWQDPLPNDDLASVQAALGEQQLGVSNQTLIEQRGYDPDVEMDRSEAENARKMTAFSRGVGMPPQQQPGQPNEAAPMPTTEPSSPFIGGGH